MQVLTDYTKLAVASLIRLGYPLYLPPPDELMPKIVYEPVQVDQRAWVVIFNCLMLNAIPASQFPLLNSLRACLRRNIRIALGDSSIFLEPRLINIIALITVATHGEDFLTPNLSWILAGHACRLSQAMNLHMIPKTIDTELRLQRIFVFWSLFAIDKSVSLAFGRPCSLPTAVYESVPIPIMSDLVQFKPHVRSNKYSAFGANFFLQRIALAKIQGKVLELQRFASFVGNTAYSAIKTGLKEQLQLWHSETQRVSDLYHQLARTQVLTSTKKNRFWRLNLPRRF